MDKQLFKVEAIKNRMIKTVSGYHEADAGYVVHRSFCNAENAEQAEERTIPQILPGTKYDFIRVTEISATQGE